MYALTAAERRSLRAKAHRLHPVVSVGQQGLTSAVLHEIDVNLLAHELIKVRVFDGDRHARETLFARICAELDAAPVQHIGKLLVLWRPAPPPARDRSIETRGTGKKMRPGRRAQRRAREDRPRASRGGAVLPLAAAKSTPHVRRPREPTARAPARPPPDRVPRVRGPSPVPSGKRRPRGR